MTEWFRNWWRPAACWSTASSAAVSRCRLGSRVKRPVGPCETDSGQKAPEAPLLAVPLRRGSNRATVSHNIGKLIGEGYPKDQAAAIAYSKAGRGKKGKK